ncbi:hypothetical protein GCM10028797_23930 [Dyella agri]
MRIKDRIGERLGTAGWHGNSLATIVRDLLDRPAAVSRNGAADFTKPPRDPIAAPARLGRIEPAGKHVLRE